MRDYEFVQDYNKRMELMIADFEKEGKVPKLLLHSCCAPCSSAVLERLTQHFEITIFYYNPNIEPKTEYDIRVKEQQRFIHEIDAKYPVSFLEGEYVPKRFHEAIKGKEMIPEGGSRCYECYQLRLEETAKMAASQQYDYFTTTLSISPYKNAKGLNEIGQKIAAEYEGLFYLYADFKKRNGYRRSIELSKEYGLYRQDYCGCVYSKKERMLQKK